MQSEQTHSPFVLVLDFGGQYKELITRRVRECGLDAQLMPATTPVHEIRAMQPSAIILTGGPSSVSDPASPHGDAEILSLGIPVLAICYGFQWMLHTLGGTVQTCDVCEYGVVTAHLDADAALFRGLREQAAVLMSHTDQVLSLPEGFSVIASTDVTPIAAVQNPERHLYGVQFHPEVCHTKQGKQMFARFLYEICGMQRIRRTERFIAAQCRAIREQVGDQKVLLGLSGGVDSSVCAALLAKAIPNQTVAVFIDHGLMRKDEGDEIERIFHARELEFIRVNAGERFFAALQGVTDPEQKRDIIGAQFLREFEAVQAQRKDVHFLAQGTIYPDVVESGEDGKSAPIKSHHNVAGLPKDQMRFDGLVEPLRSLFKDEVRRVGVKLGLPRELVERQPFPGPGLAVRIMGEITPEKTAMLQEADAIFREELARANKRYDQYFAVLTNTYSVGVTGDFRSYRYVLALRAVQTDDFMTCAAARVPYPLLERIAARIVNEVAGIGRVVYDITGKPPATVEWE